MFNEMNAVNYNCETTEQAPKGPTDRTTVVFLEKYSDSNGVTHYGTSHYDRLSGVITRTTDYFSR